MFFLVSGALVAHETFGRERSGVGLVAPITGVLAAGHADLFGPAARPHAARSTCGARRSWSKRPTSSNSESKREPGEVGSHPGRIHRRLAGGPKAVAIMSPETYAVLRDRKVAMFPVAADSRRVVVSNFERVPP
jgi:hypothetical protein